MEVELDDPEPEERGIPNPESSSTLLWASQEASIRVRRPTKIAEVLSPAPPRDVFKLVTGSGVLLVRVDGDPLAQEKRDRIYELLREYPGLHLSEVARHVDLGTNHAKYHLRVLEEHDLVSSQREDGYHRFYPREESDVGKREVLQPFEKRWLSLLRRRIPLHVTMALLEHGASSASELRAHVDIAGSTLHYHASKMEEAELVESRKDGRQRIYELHDPERVRELVHEHEPPDELVKGFLEGWEALEFP